MKSLIAMALLALVLVGCGGGGGNTLGIVTGQIFDDQNKVVRGARVWIDNHETTSNSAGTYYLDQIPEGDAYVQAEITRNSTKYIGQNVVRITGGEQAKSTNIVVNQESLLAGIEGTVRDRFGNLLQNAKIFAVGSTGLTSSMAISDRDGHYIIGRLMGGIQYFLNAGGRTYNADSDSVTLTPGEVRTINFVLSDGTNPLLNPPTNVTAVAWTTPAEAARAAQIGQPFEAVKQFLDKKRGAKLAKMKNIKRAKVASDGSNIEVDVNWDVVPENPALLGYGVYRSTSLNGTFDSIGLARDPFAVFFQDLDDNLIEGHHYYYAVTTLNTQFPDTNNSESDPSNRYGVQPLGGMTVNPVLQSPLTFRWQRADFATSYVVLLYREFPSIKVDPIWDTTGRPTSNTSFVYDGPSLQSGHHYYYTVIGLANNDDSRSISVIDSFVKN